MDSNKKYIFVIVVGVGMVLLFACCAALGLLILTADSSDSANEPGLDSVQTSEYSFYYPEYYVEGTEIELADTPPELIYSNPENPTFISLTRTAKDSVPDEVSVAVCEGMLTDYLGDVKIEYYAKGGNLSCLYMDSTLSDLGIELVSVRMWKKNGNEEYSVSTAFGEKTTTEHEKEDLVRSVKAFELK